MRTLLLLVFNIMISFPVLSQLSSDEEIRFNGIHQPKYCLFFDNHTMPACPDVGVNFDAEVFTERIKNCGVDMITFHARGNLGNAYYDTKIGTKHPSLKFDLFGELADACSRKNIELVAYFNAGISSSEGIAHREWTRLNFDGSEYRNPRMTPWVRTMCYNTPYREHLIKMIEEVAEKYPVSGFFIDCLLPMPCICPICVKQMKNEGIDWGNIDEVRRFSELSSIRLARDIANAVKVINPNYLLFFNGVAFEQQTDICTHLECECLPNGGWGYEYLPVLAHYMRTLSEMPVLNMNARFYDWGDFGSLQQEATIKSELLYGLANGMRPDIGDHFHPRGDINNAVFDRIEKIYKDLQTMEPWFDNAKNITDVAIAYPTSNSNLRDKANSIAPLRSAVRMLDELKQQFDVVTEFSDWSKYKVIILPDDITFNDKIKKRVIKHLADGKTIISSGFSGLNPEKTQFVLEKDWGVTYNGTNEFDPAYYTVGKNFNHGIPDMPQSCYSKSINIKPYPGTSVEAYLIKPYYNRQWDGEYAFFYCPPDKITDLPALTINNKVAHFSFNIFSSYHSKAVVEMRKIVGNVLEVLLPNPILKSGNLPSFSRAFVTEQPGRRMVHILSSTPELRGKEAQITEEMIELNDIEISLRLDGNVPKKVYVAPENIPLPFKIENGYIKVNIPTSKGYSLIVFEE